MRSHVDRPAPMALSSATCVNSAFISTRNSRLRNELKAYQTIRELIMRAAHWSEKPGPTHSTRAF